MPPDVAESARRWFNASSRMRNFDTAIDGINNGRLDLERAGGRMESRNDYGGQQGQQGHPDPRTFNNDWPSYYCQVCAGYCQVCGKIVGETAYPTPEHAVTCHHGKPRSTIESPGGICCQPPTQYAPHRHQSYDPYLPPIGQGEYLYGNNYSPEPETWRDGPSQPAAVYNGAMQRPPAPPFPMPQVGRANTLPSGPVHHNRPFEPMRMHTMNQAPINEYQSGGYFAGQQQGMIEQQGSPHSMDAGPTAFPRCTVPGCTAFLRRCFSTHNDRNDFHDEEIVHLDEWTAPRTTYDIYEELEDRPVWVMSTDKHPLRQPPSWPQHQ